jgi:hypothetical protein
MCLGHGLKMLDGENAKSFDELPERQKNLILKSHSIYLQEVNKLENRLGQDLRRIRQSPCEEQENAVAESCNRQVSFV